MVDIGDIAFIVHASSIVQVSKKKELPVKVKPITTPHPDVSPVNVSGPDAAEVKSDDISSQETLVEELVFTEIDNNIAEDPREKIKKHSSSQDIVSKPASKPELEAANKEAEEDDFGDLELAQLVSEASRIFEKDKILKKVDEIEKRTLAQSKKQSEVRKAKDAAKMPVTISRKFKARSRDEHIVKSDLPTTSDDEPETIEGDKDIVDELLDELVEEIDFSPKGASLKEDVVEEKIEPAEEKTEDAAQEEIEEKQVAEYAEETPAKNDEPDKQEAEKEKPDDAIDDELDKLLEELGQDET